MFMGGTVVLTGGKVVFTGGTVVLVIGMHFKRSKLNVKPASHFGG